jgi:hypothetical protein
MASPYQTFTPTMTRDSNMGLNFSQGFGSRQGPRGSTGYLEGLDNTARLGQQMQGFREAQRGREYDRGNLNLQLQQKRDADALDAQLRREGYANSSQIANLQAEASKYPHLLKQQRWTQLFPHVQGILGQAGNINDMYSGGGLDKSAKVSEAPIYDNQSIQEQVNATRAQSDASAVSQRSALSRQLAGRGFGSRSPLGMMMNQSIMGQNLMGNTAAEQQLRFNARQANAQHVLDAQKANVERVAGYNQQETERGRTRSGLLQGLFGNILGAI